MTTLKATSAPTDQCPEGTYAGRLKEIKVWTPSADSAYGNDPQLLWVIEIKQVIHANPVRKTRANPDPMQPDEWIGKEIWGFTSQMMTPKAKARAWFEGLLDRELEEDEEIELTDFGGQAVTITVGRSQTGKHKVLALTRYVKGAPVQPMIALPAADDFEEEAAPARQPVAAGGVSSDPFDDDPPF